MRSWWWVKEEKQMGLVLITITLMLQFQMNRCVGCVETERIGLLELKSYLSSYLTPKDESILKSWSHDDCCLWKRVKCSEANGGHIVDLSLDGLLQYYAGDAPPSLNLSLLHSFPQLQSLDFSWNSFTNLFDPIYGYESFQRLEKLKTLDLTGNNLNNNVLPFLSAAKSLRTLNLGYNSLEGVFPPGEFANMTQLKVLDLQNNRFSVFSDQGLVNFKELEELDLSGNGLENVQSVSGYKSFQRLEKLRTLDLFNNQLNTSSIISSTNYILLGCKNDTCFGAVFKDMPKLHQLDLYGNGFTHLGLMFPSSLQVLNLGANRLSLAPKGYYEICRLMNLRELYLRNSVLTSIPYCLGNLTRLRTLELSYNQMNGDMSSFVSSLPSTTLEYLSLLQNNFSGSFSLNSLVNHTRLRVLKLSSSVGMIQPQTGSPWVAQLKILTLQNFNLTSTILGFLIHQRELSFVDLSNNNLTGAFPTWLVQNNTRLQTLLLNTNSLTKLQLPMLAHGLEILDISSNRISGSVQQDIGIIFPNLRRMNFASNHFQGVIPSSMGEMKSLDTLDMSSNGLYGKLPTTFLSGCYSLVFLKLSNNKFQGEIFPEHTNFFGLRSLALDGNNFSGSLGRGLLNSKDLSVLDISDNSISGGLPLWIDRLSSLFYLNMRGNQLKGSLPNKFDFPNLIELRLQGNKFMGTISDTLFKTERLKVLDLRDNILSGKIPDNIDQSSSLRVLLLGNNGLQGHIPEKICQLSAVNILDLSHNQFKGVIPSCFSNMSFGAEEEILTFFPQAYFKSTFLQNWNYTSALNFDVEDAVDVEDTINVDDVNHLVPTTRVDFLTKSRYETYQGDIIDYLYMLDLSSNQLSGEIPVELGNLQNILSLSLSSNRLTGSIPDSFSKLKDLESLDLSNNELDGSIPPQLADLNNIGLFNVSYNNFSGEIPTKGHLLTFDERSYIGNAHLCGPPTDKNCSSTRVPEPKTKEEEEESDGVMDMVWFYWTCGAVYISTAVASFIFLCINARWFYRVDLMLHHIHRFKCRRFSCN